MRPVFVVVGHEHLENTLRVFSLVQNKQPVETLRIEALAFSPDGRALVSIAGRKMIVWDFHVEAWAETA